MDMPIRCNDEQMPPLLLKLFTFEIHAKLCSLLGCVLCLTHSAQAKRQGQKTLTEMLGIASPGAGLTPWPQYGDVRDYDASPGFIANGLHLMGQANLDLATEAIGQVIVMIELMHSAFVTRR